MLSCLFFVLFPVHSLVKSMCDPSLVLHSQSSFFSLSVTFTVCSHLLQKGPRLVLLPIQIMLFTSRCDGALETATHYVDSRGAVLPLNSAIVLHFFPPASTHSKLFFRVK